MDFKQQARQRAMKKKIIQKKMIENRFSGINNPENLTKKIKAINKINVSDLPF